MNWWFFFFFFFGDIDKHELCVGRWCLKWFSPSNLAESEILVVARWLLIKCVLLVFPSREPLRSFSNSEFGRFRLSCALMVVS